MVKTKSAVEKMRDRIIKIAESFLRGQIANSPELLFLPIGLIKNRDRNFIVKRLGEWSRRRGYKCEIENQRSEDVLIFKR